MLSVPPFKEETVHLASNEVSEMGETATLGWLITGGSGLGEHIWEGASLEAHGQEEEIKHGGSAGGHSSANRKKEN